MTWQEIPGLTCDEDIAEYQRLVDLVPENGLIVEVGCHKGKSLGSLAEIIKRKHLRVIAVDIWDTIHLRWGEGFKSFGKDSMLEFYQNVTALGINPVMICGTSADAVCILNEKPDMVYLDADHGYLPVKTDIEWWWPKIKKGAVLAGHDYDSGNPGVIQAVDEFRIKEVLLMKHGGKAVWSIRKEGHE